MESVDTQPSVSETELRVPGFLTTIEQNIEERPLVVLMVLSILYWGATIAIAARRPFWMDEIYTWHIVTSDSVWRILAQGFDLMPPLDFWLRQVVMPLAGNHELGLRLWSAVGIWAMCLALFEYVRRRSSVLFGLIAFLLPLTSATYHFAAEARPYGSLLGFLAASMLCWQLAGDGRRWALPLFAICFTGTFWSHYYAVLAWPAFAAAELTRSWTRRKIDWAMAAAMFGAPATLFLLLPFIREARQYSTNFWTTNSLSEALQSYRVLFEPTFFPLGLILAVVPIIASVPARHPAEESDRTWPLAEVVLPSVLMLVPLFGFILARAGTNAFHARYVQPAVLGTAVVVAYLCYRWTQPRRTVALAVVCCLALGAAAFARDRYRRGSGERDQVETKLALIERLALRSPVLVENLVAFTQIQHYISASTRGRVFLVRDWSRHEFESMTSERLRTLIGANTRNDRDFYNATPEFYYIGSGRTAKSRLEELGLADGLSFELMTSPADEIGSLGTDLYHVRIAPKR
ncbi:MAG TPA: glycosyltransferase family 39 protein [Bryobacteraceae bacterium]|nr:glycosyltransferase family 39 protein [Bryobacteraceae bacterium]